MTVSSSHFGTYIVPLLLQLNWPVFGQWQPNSGPSGQSSFGGGLGQSYNFNPSSQSGMMGAPMNQYPGISGSYPGNSGSGYRSPSSSYYDLPPSSFQSSSYGSYPPPGGGDPQQFNRPPPPINMGSPLSVTPSNSKSVSGDYCLEPLLSCDTVNTILYCLNGRCACPTQWTLSPGNQPLNTVWHPEVKRCVSVEGSGCHIQSYSTIPSTSATSVSRYNPALSSSIPPDYHGSTPTSNPTKEIASTLIKGLMGLPSSGSGGGFVYCQPGTQCVRHPGYQDVGVCAGCRNQISFVVFIFLLPFYFVFR